VSTTSEKLKEVMRNREGEVRRNYIHAKTDYGILWQ